MLGWFLMYSKVTQIYIYILFHMDYYMILNIVSCAKQKGLASILCVVVWIC